MKQIFIILGILVLLGGVGVVYLGIYDDDAQIKEGDVPDGLTQLGGGFLGAYEDPAVVIIRTEEGYEPRETTIRVGEAVSFKNESGTHHWPASDIHPTHGLYSAFDPRAPVAPGDTWTFVFEESGVWEFHDHLRANKKGIVEVVE